MIAAMAELPEVDDDDDDGRYLDDGQEEFDSLNYNDYTAANGGAGGVGGDPPLRLLFS